MIVKANIYSTYRYTTLFLAQISSISASIRELPVADKGIGLGSVNIESIDAKTEAVAAPAIEKEITGRPYS